MLILRRSAWLSLALIALSTTPLLAGKNGKGKPRGEEPPPPPAVPSHPDLEYGLEFFMTPDQGPYPEGLAPNNNLNDMNSFGDAVGRYQTPDGQWHAWLYDPTSPYSPGGQRAIDLNDLPILDMPDGAAIASAVGLNDLGTVVGYLAYNNDTTNKSPIILDMNAVPLRIQQIPTDATWTNSYARKVNNNGDVLGVFERSDSTNGAYLYHPGIAGESEPTMEFIQENLQGTTCDLNRAIGGAATQVSGTTANYQAFHHLKGLGTVVLPAGSFDNSVLVNDSGTLFGRTSIDVVVQVNRKKTEVRSESRMFRNEGVVEILEPLDSVYETISLPQACGAMNNAGVVVGTNGFAGESTVLAILPETNMLVDIGASLRAEDQAMWDPTLGNGEVKINTTGQISTQYGAGSGVMVLLTPSPK